MGLFGRSTFLDPDIEDWSFETWEWLMRRLGGVSRLTRTPLVTPTKDFFPTTTAHGHERALHVLDCVRTALDMSETACDLRPGDGGAESVVMGEYGSAKDSRQSDGQSITEGDTFVIFYAPELVDDPVRLVTVLGHQLCLRLLADLKEEPPGGVEVIDLTADLTLAYKGLGVFGANAAFDFKAAGWRGRGWSASYCGFLSEETWALAIAIFLELSARRGQARPWLEPTVEDLTKDAERYLTKTGAAKLARLSALY